MSYMELLKEYNALPPSYQREVEDFVLLLKAKSSNPPSKKGQNRILGKGKHSIEWIAKDFDEPIDDMKESME